MFFKKNQSSTTFIVANLIITKNKKTNYWSTNAYETMEIDMNTSNSAQVIENKK